MTAKRDMCRPRAIHDNVAGIFFMLASLVLIASGELVP